ncbi:MAG: hypothetical protein KIT31_12465 [Deltaproteobacteria bacterium]|nr:hypothetical protein [Deltaproteobacteria bacterium]
MLRPTLFLVSLGAIARVAVADAPAPPKPVTIDDTCVDRGTCKTKALDHFAAALAAQKAGKADRPLRIAYLGDSLTAADEIVHGLREKLGKVLGAGGPGFVHAANPHPFDQNNAVVRWIGGGWTVHGVSTAMPADRLLGLGGSAEGSGTIRFATVAPVRSIDVHYLAQPRGGALAIVADKLTVKVDTSADTKRSEFKRVELPEGTRRVELQASGVRLFGATLEAARGVVVDNLGVVNATAKGFATNIQPDHLRNQLAHRAPDLTIVMLGTNEAEWLGARGPGMAEHEKVFGDLLATVRAANPDSSCLVVSPLDQMDWRDPQFQPRTSVPAMVDAQHRAATAHGCAFWNLYDWMGGKGSSLAWFRRGLLIKDFQHPTAAGAALLADALYAGLVR